MKQVFAASIVTVLSACGGGGEYTAASADSSTTPAPISTPVASQPAPAPGPAQEPAPEPVADPVQAPTPAPAQAPASTARGTFAAGVPQTLGAVPMTCEKSDSPVDSWRSVSSGAVMVIESARMVIADSAQVYIDRPSDATALQTVGMRTFVSVANTETRYFTWDSRTDDTAEWNVVVENATGDLLTVYHHINAAGSPYLRCMPD